MVLVVSSGIFGRYIYARIPKTLDGVFLDDSEIEIRQQKLLEQLEAITGISSNQLQTAVLIEKTQKKYSVAQALSATLKFDVAHYSTPALNRILQQETLNGYQKQEAKDLAQELARTSSQRAIKEPFQKVFGYWHVFHIPLTAVMFIILIVHVIVAVMFGYTWIL